MFAWITKEATAEVVKDHCGNRRSWSSSDQIPLLNRLSISRFYPKLRI